MRRRPRRDRLRSVRQIIGWGTPPLLVVVAALFVLSWSVRWSTFTAGPVIGPDSSGRYHRIEHHVMFGRGIVGWTSMDVHCAVPFNQPASNVNSLELAWAVQWVEDRWSIRPRSHTYPGVGSTRILPLWMPVAAFAVPTAWAGVRRLRRKQAGCCRACGYDLAGLPPAVALCPECGAGLTPSRAAAAPGPTLTWRDDAMEYPTAQTVDEWDDASLFAATGVRAAALAASSGYEALNQAERTICCLFELVNEVSNGGFGQWLFNLHPCVLGQTASACETVNARAALAVVKGVLSGLPDPLSFPDGDRWREYLHALPQHRHQEFEGYALSEAEAELYRCAYRYARERWAEVRATT